MRLMCEGGGKLAIESAVARVMNERDMVFSLKNEMRRGQGDSGAKRQI
jgi:hypothetical protein